MRLRLPILAALTAIALGFRAPAEEPSPSGPIRLTLEEAIARAMETSEDVEIADLRYRQTALIRDRAKALLAPRVDVAAARTYPRDMTGDWQDPDDPVDTASISVTQPLINSDAYTSMRGSRYLRDAAMHQKNFAVENALLVAAQAFLSYLQAQSGLETALETVKMAKEQLDATRTRYDAGQAPKTDQLRAEVELSRAERALERVQNHLVSERLNLARLTGLDDRPFTAVAPADFVSFPFDASEPPQELLEEAVRNRKDLEQMRNDVKVAEWTLRQARYRLLPSADFNFTESWVDPETATQFDDFWTAAFRLHLPLFEGGQRLIDVKDARYALEQAKLALDRQEKIVRQEAADAWLTAKTAKAHLAAFVSELKLAEENYDVTKEQYSSGHATSLDLIDAFTQLTLARANHATQTFEYYRSVLTLLRQLGRFAAEFATDAQEGDPS